MPRRGAYRYALHGFGDMYRKRRKPLAPCSNSPNGRHSWSYGVCVYCGKTKSDVAKERRKTKKCLKAKYPNGAPEESGRRWNWIIILFIIWLIFVVFGGN